MCPCLNPELISFHSFILSTPRTLNIVIFLKHGSTPLPLSLVGHLPELPSLKYLPDLVECYFITKVFSCCLVAQLCLIATIQTVAHQASLSMGLSRQDYWSGLPFPSPEDLSDPGIEPASPVSPALKPDSLPLSHDKVSLQPTLPIIHLCIVCMFVFSLSK